MRGEQDRFAGGARVPDAQGVEQARREVDQAALAVDGFGEVEGEERSRRFQHGGRDAQVQGDRHVKGFVTQLGERRADRPHLDQDVLLVGRGRGIDPAIDDRHLALIHERRGRGREKKCAASWWGAAQRLLMCRAR